MLSGYYPEPADGELKINFQFPVGNTNARRKLIKGALSVSLMYIVFMSPTDWAKKNKKVVAKDYIDSLDFGPSSEPTAFFTAGLPGVGKTELLSNLGEKLTESFARIDMDEIATIIPGYSPKRAQEFREAAGNLLGYIYTAVIRAKYNFMLDGTFAHSRAMENLQRAISREYVVSMYIIYQDPVQAWEFVKAREKVDGRHVDRTGFIRSYYNLLGNLEALTKLSNHVNINVIIKDGSNQMGEIQYSVSEPLELLPEYFKHQKIEDVIL